MRALVCISVGVVLALLIVNDSRSVEEISGATARQILGLSDCDGCGAEKLTDGEITNLVSVITSRRGISYLEESARQYMAKQGWLATEIIGYKKAIKEPTSIEEVLILAVREGQLVTLEGPITKKPLMTGLYWSKGIGSGWEVLNSDGSSDTYWASEVK